MNLLPAMLELWDDARFAFKQARTWQRACRLGLSQLACLERHTVTGLLCTSGRQSVDWTSDYRLYSKDVWEPNELFRPVISGALKLLPDPHRVVVAIDDTIIRKTGMKIPGVARRRDPLSPAFHPNLVLGQRFLQFSLLVPRDHQPPSAARAVPCRFAHVPSAKKPRRTAPAEDWSAYREAAKQKNLNTAAGMMLQQLREELDLVHDAADSHLVLVVDGSYTNKTVLNGLPPQATLIGRIRKDAKLYFMHGQSRRQYGDPAPTPDAFRQDEAHPWQRVEAYAAGQIHEFRIKTLAPLCWRKSGTQLALRLVVIAPVGYRLTQQGRLLYRQPAYLICTDPDLSPGQLVQEYLWRWDIEVNHRDEKQIIGVGEAQLWSRLSVERHPAMAVASYGMLLLASMTRRPDELDSLLPPPKWQRRAAKSRLSTPQLIQALRYEVWGSALEEVTRPDRPIDFATATPTDTKSPERLIAPVPPIAFARTG
jgi:hypothetical protein